MASNDIILVENVNLKPIKAIQILRYTICAIRLYKFQIPNYNLSRSKALVLNHEINVKIDD